MRLTMLAVALGVVVALPLQAQQLDPPRASPAPPIAAQRVYDHSVRPSRSYSARNDGRAFIRAT